MGSIEDIAPDLLKEVKSEFQNNINKSKKIKKLMNKVKNGTASYIEANEYSVEVGSILADAYKNSITADILPDGKMYYNIADRVITPTMTDSYDLVSNVVFEIQTSLNEAAGIGIKAIEPELNNDRIEGVVNKISAADNYNDVAWVLNEPIKNFTQSVADDSIKANSEFQGKAGLHPKIIRKLAGNCCDWCKEMAGTYTYPDVPQDVYKRHQRCRCTVEYDPGSGKVQNVHTKAWNEKSADEINKKTRYAGMTQYEKALENEKQITSDVKEVGKEIGLEAYGLENRIKSKRRYLEKLQANIDNGKSEVNDILRYNLGNDNPEILVSKINESIDKFNEIGYNTVEVKNTWKDKKNPYKGINTNVVAPNGQKFEVQYHTKESFEAKEKMHNLYEEARIITDKKSGKYLELQDKMIEISDKLTIPKGIEGVDTYGK